MLRYKCLKYLFVRRKNYGNSIFYYTILTKPNQQNIKKKLSTNKLITVFIFF